MPQSLVYDIIQDFELHQPKICRLEEKNFRKKNIEVSILRLDEIHPALSGNKLFKLYYFLKEAKKSSHKKVITFGGAYSNHLAATAFACRKNHLKCVGIVRGEKPAHLSPTLLYCLENSMHLEFLSRSSYREINQNSFLNEINKNYGEHILIPEGGFSVLGAKGAGLINQLYNENDYTQICLPVGTATTFAGMVIENKKGTEIIGFGVLKNMYDLDKRFEELHVNINSGFSFINDYHFGGYAKKTIELITFMNSFYDHHKIPLDFVYTAKMMFGILDLISKDYFSKGTKILCIHTGGLQGNVSLKEGSLHF